MLGRWSGIQRLVRPQHALKAHKWPRRLGMLHQLLPFEGKGQGFATASGEASVSIHCLAVYIHEQINGTFADIFQQLSERIDLLELPNNGSSTMVSLEDAHLIVEDIGVHKEDLMDFLADYQQWDRSIGFPEIADDHTDSKPVVRHPRHALYGLRVKSQNDMPTPEFSAEPLSTKELLAKSKRAAEGIYFKKAHAGGYMVYSRKGRFPLTGEYIKQYPIDTEFNAWYNTHKSEGWVACTGACKAQKAVCWYNVANEEAPVISKNLADKGCIGYCQRARRSN